MHQLKSCGVLVVRGDPIDSFLLLHHTERYDLPKGHVDPGESDLECALRELREETSIGADDIVVDPQFRYSITYLVRSRKLNYQLCRKHLIMFLGRLQRDVVIEPTEHISFEWRDWDPPHRIQAQLIDPILRELADYVNSSALREERSG